MPAPIFPSEFQKVSFANLRQRLLFLFLFFLPLSDKIHLSLLDFLAVLLNWLLPVLIQLTLFLTNLDASFEKLLLFSTILLFRLMSTRLSIATIKQFGFSLHVKRAEQESTEVHFYVNQWIDVYIFNIIHVHACSHYTVFCMSGVYYSELFAQNTFLCGNGLSLKTTPTHPILVFINFVNCTNYIIMHEDCSDSPTAWSSSDVL